MQSCNRFGENNFFSHPRLYHLHTPTDILPASNTYLILWCWAIADLRLDHRQQRWYIIKNKMESMSRASLVPPSDLKH